MIDGVFKVLEACLRIAGRLLGLLRKIPVVDDGIARIQLALLNPIITKLIRSPKDPDLDAALDLYRRRIPDDQRFQPDDIVRWISDDRFSRGRGGPSDWFMVAKFRRRVCGFILFHYYPPSKLALFAYMVVSNTPGVQFDAVSRSLTVAVSELLGRRKELRGFRGFVLEVRGSTKREGEAQARRVSCARKQILYAGADAGLFTSCF